MTLTAHAITGAGLACLMPERPLLGFAVGFISHFVLDAIPHWDYHLNSMKEDRKNPMNNDLSMNMNFAKDFIKIGLDGVVGLLLSYFILCFWMNYSLLIVLCGAIGAMAPDALQFVYMKWRHQPFTSLQKFHLWIHAEEI
jgi:hypothetical protein